MSAGEFVTGNYLASYGAGTNIHPVRVQPETLQAEVNDGTGVIANSGSPDPRTSPISASISRGARSRGLRARLLYLKNPATPPDGYDENSTTVIPALTPQFAAIAVTTGTISYLGTTWEVTGTGAEIAR